MKKNTGFIFIETIIVVCVLTVSLMSLYTNYSKIMANTKELNTFDVTEYNYKTFFLKKRYEAGDISLSVNTCIKTSSHYNYFSDSLNIKICRFNDVSTKGLSSFLTITNIDPYIIDYINSQDFTSNNDDIFLVEYKKEDKQNPSEYLTYISSLNY